MRLSHFALLCYFNALLVLFIDLTSASAQSKKAIHLGQAPVQAVLRAMTLEEKATLVVGMQMLQTNAVATKGVAGHTAGISRLGIPSISLADGSMGLRLTTLGNNIKNPYYTTRFPSGTLMASTWDVSLMKEAGAAIGNEAKCYGIDVLLAPAINLQRNPLGGRNYEYYSEDPVLSGKLAGAMINGIQSQQVAASLKHFAANNQETHRKSVNVVASERTLRELYLKGFEIAIGEGHPLTVMSSYNKLNGIYAPQNEELLEDILRGEWHFQGIVMSDWNGGDDPVAQVKAGNDLIMPGNTLQSQAIVAAVQNHQLPEELLNRNVLNILKFITKTLTFKKMQQNNAPQLEVHANVAKRVAEEGMVLLKNDNNALPIKNTQKLAIFGETAYKTSGDASTNTHGEEQYISPVYKGLKNARFPIDSDVSNFYLTRLQNQALSPKNSLSFSQSKQMEPIVSEDAIQRAANSDAAAIVCIGRTSVKGTDRTIQDDFELTDNEMQLIRSVNQKFHASGKKVIVLLTIAGPVETNSWQNQVDGILLTWQPGAYGGDAVADLLCGKVNPSGKLTTTFPIRYNDEPSAQTYPGNMVAEYKEGIYMGYRYFNSFKIPIAYEFGYGLSYTNFTFSKMHIIHQTKHQLTISIDVKNTGKYTGKEVIQLYAHAPKSTLDKPSDELKSFAKTKLLHPGEIEHITFTVSYNDLASYNTDKGAWIADNGTYIFNAGSSSRDFKTSIKFNLPYIMILPIKRKH